MERRAFLRAAVSAPMATVLGGTAGVAHAHAAETGARSPDAPEVAAGLPGATRAYWVAHARRLADPILGALEAGRLRATMPVQERKNAGRAVCTHLEAVGRLYAGLAPWWELPNDGSAEGQLRAWYAQRAQHCLALALDPKSPDRLNFTEGSQPLVDAAFLAQATLRAPRVLRDGLDPTTRALLVAALKSTRAIQTGQKKNNWLLFPAMVEAALATFGEAWEMDPVQRALQSLEDWYKGDGIYGDGPQLRYDYYNGFVIHPMLVDIVDTLEKKWVLWSGAQMRARSRARRHASVLERLISPDGSFPPVGRSLAYRAGAFQPLAQMALQRDLGRGLPPAQVRCALTAVLRRTLDVPGTFDANGWLRIGLAGSQPGVGENYISTGSLYMCATALLPLGLPAADPFWSSPDLPWTSKRAWAGQPFPIDRALI
jgi:hypothetical protein